MDSFSNNKNIAKVIKILGEIIDKKDENALTNSFFLSVLKDIFKVFFPEKRFIVTYGVSYSFLFLISLPLRYFKSKYYIYEALVVIIIYIVYVLDYGIYLYKKKTESARIDKESPSHSEQLVSSILGKERTLAEKNYEPFFDNHDIERILQHLISFDSNTLKSAELKLTYQDGLLKKNFEYFGKFVPIFLPLLIYTIYTDKQSAAIMISLISLFVFYIQIKSEKYSIKSKYELCIYLLKQAQVLKNE